MLIKWLKEFKKNVLDVLYPVECLICGQAGSYLCKKCQLEIKTNLTDVCPVCKKKSPYGKIHPWCKTDMSLDGLIVAVDQTSSELTAPIIHHFKYHFIKIIAPALADLLIAKIIQLDQQKTQPNWVRLLLASDDLMVVPIPLHARRLRWRGFNQAELLAKNMCQKFNLTLRNHILIRKKYTTPQVQLKRRKRLNNLKNVFKLNKEWRDKIKGSKILLVDDVATTGATMNECAKILKQFGALEVWGIVLKRG